MKPPSPTANPQELTALLRDYPPDAPHWSLQDAFDAVTNGIENPESLALMESIGEPQFQPWKQLVYAIKALYQKDIDSCKKALDAIDDASPPARLKPLFRLWIEAANVEAANTETSNNGASRLEQSPPHRTSTKGRDPVLGLYHKLLIQPNPLSLLAQQAEEALRQGMEDYFNAQACRIMRGFLDLPAGKGPLLALRYSQYCLDLLRQAGLESPRFLDSLIKTLGEADGYCAIGFSHIGTDDTAAAEALHKALTAGDGRFLDEQMAPLVAGILPLLKGRKKQPSPRRGKTEEQLELFGSPNI